MDYDKDLTIDPNGLDIEWLKQPMHKKATLSRVAYTFEKNMGRDRFDFVRHNTSA